MVTLVNRAKVTTPTTGTGPLALGPEVDGFQSFGAAGVVDGDLVRYVLEEGSAWEIGTGLYAASGPTLTRSPLQSSAGGAPIALTGKAQVFVAATTEDFEARLPRTGGSMTGPLRLEWNATHAPLSLPNTGTTEPATLTDGDLWHRSSTLYAHLGGTTRTLIHNGNPTALASDMTQAEAEAGSANTRRWVTAQRLRQAILGWWSTSADKTKLDSIAAGAQVNVPTHLSVTGGTTDGPTITTSTGTSATLPTASATASGVVTTGPQSFAGEKTFSSTITGSISGNAATANALAAARILTIGSTAKAFNGTTDLSWSTAEIGAWPIGAVYIQFPGRDAPSTLFGGSWARIFDTEGVFFRTEGEEATSFGGGIQQDQMQRMTGSVTLQRLRGSGYNIGGHRAGIISNTNATGNSGAGSFSASSPSSNDGSRIDFDTASSPNARTSSATSGETRPRNRTIRIWRRTG